MLITPSAKMSKNDIDSMFSSIHENIGMVTYDNLVLIAALIMEYVKKCIKLNGFEKKNLVLFFMNKLIDEYIEIDEKEKCLQIMQLIIPSAIDVLIDVSKHKIKLKSLSKIPLKFKNIFKKFKCPCVFVKV